MGDLALSEGNHSFQRLYLLIQLRLKRQAVCNQKLINGTLQQQILRLSSELVLSLKSCILAAYVATLFLKFGKIAIYLFDDLIFHPTEKLSCLSSSLRSDHQCANHTVNILCLVVFLLLPQVECLIHEVGEVRDGWNRIHIESVNHNFIKVTAERSLYYHSLLLLFGLS